MNDEIPFGANEVRLSVGDWIVAIAICVVVLAVLPYSWQARETLGIGVPGSEERMPSTGTSPGPVGVPLGAYRIPFGLSGDNWVYARLLEQTTASDVVLIGDSVVWGEYVTPDHTLSAVLNTLDDRRLYINGGLNGLHPLAMEGLVRYVATELRDRQVILHLNLLWFSTPQRDLQVPGEGSFNHPDLIPQVWPSLPAYTADADTRIGRVLDRYQPYRQLVHHIRVAWFGGVDIPSWCLEHPRENFLRQIRWRLPAPSQEPRHVAPRSGRNAVPPSWEATGIPVQDMPWIELGSSLQWAAFERAIRVLESRGNDVLVLVGPFNEHLLAAVQPE